ncbi:MAG: L-lactate dehydrogenase [Candidatus Omnitrophica bacterium]|nr:L-lactate dehydrogenase [Candidatus Omnitrophota bacterium]MBD3268581.1 L-lactate dehydrogenase [Candidatus Omnitrophota bacterium]
MKSLEPKVSIIGAGNVGSTFAFSLLTSGLAREIVLVDKNRRKADGECMDLNHGLSFTKPAKIYSAGYEGCKDSDVVVITAGAKQKPGQTRLDLVKTNTEIFKSMVPDVVKNAPDSTILVVTNPVDILTYVTLKISGLPKKKVLGSGTVLDTSRFRYSISSHCNVDTRNVHAYIIGEHGDTELPVWSNANIGGMVFAEYCPFCDKKCEYKKELNAIFEKVKNAAYQIIDAKGATYYAIALALVRIVEALLRDENSVLPVSTLIEDYCEVNDVCLSVPSIINASGVEKILRLRLSDEEKAGFQKSASSLKKILSDIEL